MTTPLIPLQTLLDQIAHMRTDEEIARASQAEKQFLLQATDEEKAQLKAAMNLFSTRLMEESQRLIDEATAFLEAEGIIIGPPEWLVVKDYAKKYNTDAATIDAWVKQGLIPPDDIDMVVEEHNLYIIRDKIYRI